jgi:hypothetical protein
VKGFGLKGSRTHALGINRIEAAKRVTDDEKAFGDFSRSLVMTLDTGREAMRNYL